MQPPVEYHRVVWWSLALIALALGAALVPIPPAAIEAGYSTSIFPIIQTLLTGVSNVVPFALLDVLIALVLVLVLYLTWRDVKAARAQQRWLKPVVQFSRRLLVAAAAAYLAFLVAWGFNYRRVPLAEKLQFDASRVSRDAAFTLAQTTVDRVNTLHEAAHRGGWRDLHDFDGDLAEAFRRARLDMALTGLTRPGRPKKTLLDAYFRSAGVAGMTDPFFLETFVASDLLPFERPAVIAHEWSHLAGIADEGDANFVAWLTCLRGTPGHQYSGWLALYGDVAGTLDREQRRAVSERLADGPRADLQAVRERYERNVNRTVSTVGWRAYDQYLKANRVEEGSASYADVVRLVLGTEFGPDWSPVLRKR